MTEKKKINVLGILAAILSVVQIAIGAYMIITLSKYSGISESLFTSLFVSLALILFLILVMGIYGLTCRKNVVSVLAIILSAGIIAASIYGIGYINRLEKSIDNMINTETEQTETNTVAFVTFNNKELENIDDFSMSTKFGYIDNESFIAGNVLALEVLEKNSLYVNQVPYDNYNDLIWGLFSGEVEVAALPDNYYSMFSVNDGYEEYLDQTEVIYTYSKDMVIENLGGNDKDLTTEPFTVLLMGMDEQRTDTLILASFNPLRMTVTLTSIARDSYVPIACYKGQASDKINHSRTVSRQCTIDTVQNLMGIDIDFYVEVNFYGVVEMVDAMGGLLLYSPVTFVGQQAGYENDSTGRGHFNVWVGKGWLQRDGQQTLALARERHAMPNGDFDRQQHQQEVIQAMVKKMLEMRDVDKILSVIEAAGDNVKTNFDLNQMTQLINFGIKAINTTYEGKITGVNGIFNIINTRVTGYSSSTYNDSLELNLWIYKLYKGSIADNKAVILRNIWKDDTLRADYSGEYDTLYPYYDQYQYITKDFYNEVQVHEPTPDTMPNMVNSYTLKDVKAWLKERNWITLNVVEVKEGDELYDQGYRHNVVIKQSINSGKKTSNITELTI